MMRVLRLAKALVPAEITTGPAPTLGVPVDVPDGRRLVQGPRPVTNGDVGRDCCARPLPCAAVRGYLLCLTCNTRLTAAWHGEEGRIHTSVAGSNEPLEFP